MSRVSETLRDISLRKKAKLPTKTSPDNLEANPVKREAKKKITTLIGDVTAAFEKLLELTKGTSESNNKGDSHPYHTTKSIRDIREARNEVVRLFSEILNFSKTYLENPDETVDKLGTTIRLLNKEVAKDLTQSNVLYYKGELLKIIEVPIISFLSN